MEDKETVRQLIVGILRTIDSKCRICEAKMSDAERQLSAPAYDVFFTGKNCESNADIFVDDVEDRGWKVERQGHDRVRVDPTPDFIHESCRKK